MIFAFNGRKNTANHPENNKRFAVFFLLSVFLTISAFAKSNNPVYVHENRLWTLEKTGDSVITKPLADRKIPFKARNIGGSLENLCVWDSAGEKLLFFDKKRNLKPQVSLKGGLVRTNGKFLYAVGKNFENKGFNFSFYEIKKSFFRKKSLKKLFEAELDCFVSDTVFSEKGIWFCGGNKDDTSNSVYFADFSALNVRKLFETEKKSDFLRLIIADKAANSVYSFQSGRIKHNGVYKLYEISENSSANTIDLSACEDFPENAAGMFGFGLSYKNQLLLPVSTDNSQISVLVYDTESGQIVKTFQNSNGIFLPVGQYDSRAFYIAKDPIDNPDYSALLYYDGSGFGTLKKY